LAEKLMPIYAYKCTSCGFAQDEMHKVSDAQLTVCPSCGKADYAKQVTAAGFALKGNGWYATDFKGGNTKPAEAKVETKTEAPSSACGTSACPASN
jgi:putative FmdB family regulatory protein